MARLIISAVAVFCVCVTATAFPPGSFPMNRQPFIPKPLKATKTVGQVWPLPQQITTGDTVVSLNPETFVFKLDDSCDIITAAFYRYIDIIFNPPRASRARGVALKKWQKKKAYMKRLLGDVQGELPSLDISLTGSCETFPSLNMDEQYQLSINSDENPLKAQIVATTTWGVLRGLETFSQLVYYDSNSGLYLVNTTTILDFPRFSHRGILVDTARHYLSKQVLYDHLDAMTYNKMNVLHWHIVDDQSFPYQSQQFPDISEKGAYNPETHIYTFQDIADVINYATQRGIRVVPEFDTPGHTEAWGPGVPGLLTQCYSGGSFDGTYGPINPILDSSYAFLQPFFAEVLTVFKDQYLHLGGDEVSFDCWESNPDITAYMSANNLTTYEQLEGVYIAKLLDIVSNLNSSYIVWQEVFDNGVQIKPDTVVEVWKGGEMAEMNLVTGSGFKAILSSCWYLDYISYGSDWKTYYACEPLAFNGTQQQFDLVMGGEACLWAEFVDGTNFMARMWPRASAVAERLWSSQDQTSADAAAPRLEEHRCRLLTRGLNAEPPNGPGFCDADYLVD